MGATTLRLPDKKLKILRAISGFENKPISKIIEGLVDEYIKSHYETMEALKISDFARECIEGLEEIKSGKGKSFDELED